MFFGDLDSAFVTFFVNDIGFESMSLFNINFDDEIFHYCDSETVNHVRLIDWYNKFKQVKAPKKGKWRVNACSVASNKIVVLVLARKREKKIKPIFTDKVGKW